MLRPFGPTPAPEPEEYAVSSPAAGRARRRADHRRGTPLQPAPDHPRRRDDRSEAAQERQGARHRRRRPRLPRAALPRRGRRRHARHRRVRRGRRVEPAAPDHPRPERHRAAQGESARESIAETNPLVNVVVHERAPRQRQRDAGLRGLRPDRRRHRQLRDPLHGQRRGVLPEDPLRLGLDLPLRRPGVGLLRRRSCATTRPATAASTPSRRRRAWSRRCAEGGVLGVLCAASARSRSTRRSSCSPASATRWSAS